MNIGQKINEFDKTTGTVQDFNKLFPLTPIDNQIVHGTVEIGEALVGFETVREVFLTTSKGTVTLKKDLLPVTANYQNKGGRGRESDETRRKKSIAQKKRKPNAKYTITKDGVSKEFTLAKDAAAYMGVAGTTFSQYVAGRWKNTKGYTIKKERL